MKYENDKEIEALVATFEDASIARGIWKHAEHLVVALYYANKYDNVETATTRMRDGLFNLLTEGFKIDLTKEMPYHETLTVFWMRIVREFSRTANGLPLHEKANSLIEKFDKDYPLKFYTRDFLFSDEARSRFVEPDLAPSDQVVQSN
ncbi:MAG: hypothetical protein ACJ72Z_03070 [Pyrinomonadaceae bacterium]